MPKRFWPVRSWFAAEIGAMTNPTRWGWYKFSVNYTRVREAFANLDEFPTCAGKKLSFIDKNLS